MIQPTNSRRRADRGTLIVRASVVAVGIAASVGLQLSEPADPKGPVRMSARDSQSAMCTNADGSFAFL
ncbi:MAG TPA: hypothetical protein VMT83_14780 [Burkholderiaceae bacterium]|jgi:hypothetical protein|nr:hypothetical protein [Burkholderiaceae bacterium]